MEIRNSVATEGVVMEPAAKKNRGHTGIDRLFRYAEFLNFGEVHLKFDHATGLRAIVAIHNLNRGPAIGGARLISYPTAEDAIEDALRLAQMMSFKSAISNLSHGGAKAVLLKPKVIKDRKAYFEAFGDFVNSLGGRYITAVDSGTNTEDMDVVFTRTRFVTSNTASGSSGDPSPHTALGVLKGIEAAVKYKLKRESLEGVHVLIQGAGHVGYYLARELFKKGARLTISDVNPEAIKTCVEEFNAKICPVENIYDVEADVFAPCALGAILNLNNIKRLKCSIVAGSANNQLAHHHHGVVLKEKNILYAPDFVINAGGLIYVSAIYDYADKPKAIHEIENIYNTLLTIFERAEKENLSTNEVAEKIAIERLKQSS